MLSFSVSEIWTKKLVYMVCERGRGGMEASDVRA